MIRSLKHLPLMSLGRFNQTQETCYFNLTLPKIINGIKGLLEILGQDYGIEERYQGYSKTWGHGICRTSRKPNKQKYIYFSRIKIKHFPRRTDKRKYLFISSRYNKYIIHHSTDVKLWQFRWRKLAFRKMTRLNYHEFLIRVYFQCPI